MVYVLNSAKIHYRKGLYHRQHPICTEAIWRPTMYLRDDKLEEFSKEQLKKMCDEFMKRQKEERNIAASGLDTGVVIVRNGSAFIPCLKNGEMIGFLLVLEKLKAFMKDHLTAEYITGVAENFFELHFGLYYRGTLCSPKARLGDYYYNWNGLEIRVKKVEESGVDQSLEEKNEQLQEFLQKMEKAVQTANNWNQELELTFLEKETALLTIQKTLEKKEMELQKSQNSLKEKEKTLQECQESLQQMAKSKDELEEKVKTLEKEKSRLLEQMNQLLVEKNRNLEEEVKALKEQQPKKTTEETGSQQSSV